MKLKKLKKKKLFRKKPTKLSWPMSAKSDTQLPDFLHNEVGWIASKIIYLEITILALAELIEKMEQIKKNIRTWGCGTSRF